MKPYYETKLGKLYRGDCLEIMPALPKVDLIVADIPYNLGKGDWDKYKADEYQEFIQSVFRVCEKGLKDNGSFYWFHSEMDIIAKFMVYLENTAFVFRQMITVNKTDNSFIKDLYGTQNHFRNYLNLAEYILFYTFQDETGLIAMSRGNKDKYKSIKTYMRMEKSKCEQNGIDIDAIVPHTTNFHFFANGLSFSMPTEDNYKLLQTTGFFKKHYGYLRAEYENLRAGYEDLRTEHEGLRYTFNKTDGLANVWNYRFKDGKYNHRTVKPLNLIMDIVSHSSNEGDLILDPFLGSGTTAVACEKLGRRYIGVEILEEYCEIAKKRIEVVANQRKLF